MKTQYPICPRCNKQSVAAAHLTSDDSRNIYCTSGSCDYKVDFKDLTTPIPFELTPSEALYGFIGWLTAREESITMGAKHEAATPAYILNEFCKANNLEAPRESYARFVVRPEIPES